MDYQAKYEAFLKEVLTDVNTKVQAAQLHAEDNARGRLGAGRKITSNCMGGSIHKYLV